MSQFKSQNVYKPQLLTIINQKEKKSPASTTSYSLDFHIHIFSLLVCTLPALPPHHSFRTTGVVYGRAVFAVG